MPLSTIQHTRRTWRVAAVVAVLFAFVSAPILWTTAGASDADRNFARQAADGTDEADLDERVAELETQVAALRTAVSELQGDGASEMTEGADGTEPTPTPTPLAVSAVSACGRPFASWGAATSDGVNVQLLQVMDGASAGHAVEGADVYVLEVALENRRDDKLAYDPEDFVLVDCDGVSSTALADGVAPSIAEGKLGPGGTERGWLTFAVTPGAQPAAFVYGIQSPGRTGAEVSCPLVDRDSPPAPLGEASGGAGCSARGGSG